MRCCHPVAPRTHRLPATLPGMDLLIIGGSRFLGRHLVDAALARGDRVTLFNRGQSGPAPAGVATLQGDRKSQLQSLTESGRRWDAVVDTCGYLPGDVARMADALAGRVGRYLFVSSISAYASAALPTAEDAPLGHIDDADTQAIDGRSYGPLKALCEAAVRRRLGDAASILVRPGLIVGPHDPTERFTWWPARLARAADDGLPVLVPGAPQRPLQAIHARDLADWMLGLIDSGASGAFNATSPPGAASWGDLIAACAQAAGVQPRLCWVDDAHLLGQGIEPWKDLPLWLPAEGPYAAEHAAFMAVPTARAQATGLRCRPLIDTVADTLSWWRALPAERRAFAQTGLAPEREAALLSSVSP
jgi:2'-hydroxyisoflavone reductase